MNNVYEIQRQLDFVTQELNKFPPYRCDDNTEAVRAQYMQQAQVLYNQLQYARQANAQGQVPVYTQPQAPTRFSNSAQVNTPMRAFQPAMGNMNPGIETTQSVSSQRYGNAESNIPTPQHYQPPVTTSSVKVEKEVYDHTSRYPLILANGLEEVVETENGVKVRKVRGHITRESKLTVERDILKDIRSPDDLGKLLTAFDSYNCAFNKKFFVKSSITNEEIEKINKLLKELFSMDIGPGMYYETYNNIFSEFPELYPIVDNLFLDYINFALHEAVDLNCSIDNVIEDIKELEKMVQDPMIVKPHKVKSFKGVLNSIKNKLSEITLSPIEGGVEILYKEDTIVLVNDILKMRINESRIIREDSYNDLIKLINGSAIGVVGPTFNKLVTMTPVVKEYLVLEINAPEFHVVVKRIK